MIVIIKEASSGARTLKLQGPFSFVCGTYVGTLYTNICMYLSIYNLHIYIYRDR